MDRCHCRDCGAENRVAALFCRECGARLDNTYPAAGQQPGESESAIAGAAEFAETGLPGPGTGPLTRDGGGPDQNREWERERERADRKSADRIARAAGMAPLSRRPWMLALLAVLIVGGVSTLAGWQTQWPGAIFGVQKTAVIKPAPPTQAPAQVQASTPDSFAPSTPGNGAAVAPSVPASVVDAYFAAINAGDYATAWALGGSNTGPSYSEFVAGFAGTSNDAVTILSTAGDVVTARLVAQQDDGSTRTFEGTYTVSGGVITSADVKQTG
jgi:hypothetical protein